MTTAIRTATVSISATYCWHPGHGILSTLRDTGADVGYTRQQVEGTAEDFQAPDNVVQLGVPPVRIDLITSISGVSWAEADASKERGTLGDVPVYFIGRNQYIANKRASGRKKDLADLESLGEE